MIIDFINRGGGGSYTLPTASTTTLGGIKVGQNLSIDGNGVLSSQAGGEQVVELTQAEYNALSGYAENTIYVITDAVPIDMDDYATVDDLETVSGATDIALGQKADKQNVAAYTGSSYYSTKKIATWNAQGVITGSEDISNGFSSINGSNRCILNTYGGTFTIYAPTAAGTQNQLLVSNGSGAPVWTNQKIVFCTQTQYDALTPDATTLYIITGD